MRNEGDRVREAGVAVDVSYGGSAQNRVRYAVSATVPPRSERTLHLAMIYDVPPEAFLAKLRSAQNEQSFADGTTRTIRSYKRDVLAVDVDLIDLASGNRVDRESMLALPVHPQEFFAVTADEEVPPLTADEQYRVEGCDYVLGEREVDADAASLPLRPPFASTVSTQNFPGSEVLPYGVRLARVGAEKLPPRWALYEGVDALFLGSLSRPNAPPSGLDPQQRRSLLRWVRAGGRLVVCPTHSMDLYRHAFWRQLLPVQLIGTRLLETAVGVLESHGGHSFPAGRPAPTRIAEALPGTGEIVLESAGHVLLARRQVGGGEVWFSAVPGKAMADWRGGPAFWRALFEPVSDPVPGLKSSLAADAAALVGGLAGAAAPSKALIVQLVFAYMLLSVSVLFFSRLLGHPEWGWPLVVVFAVLVTLLALAAGAAAHRKVGFVAGEVGVTVLGDGESHASATSFVGLHAPREKTVDIRWPNPDTLAAAQPPDAQSAGAGLNSAVTVQQDDCFTFPAVALRPGELQLSRAMTLVRYEKGVELDVALGPEGLEGTVVNRSGEALEDCILRLNRRTFRLGTIPAGETVDLSRAPAGWDLRANPYGVAAGQEAKLRQWVLADCLHKHRGGLGEGHGVEYQWPVALYGWTRTPQAEPVPTGFEGKPRHRALQLLALPEPHPSLRSGRVVVPEGTCGIRTVNSPARMLLMEPVPRRRRDRYVSAPGMKRIAGMDRRGTAGVRVASQGRANLPMERRIRPPGWSSGKGTVRAELQFFRPDWLQELAVDSITVVADVRLSGIGAEIAVRRPGSEHFVPILGEELGEGRALHVLENAAEFLGPDGELPEFQIRLGLDQTIDTRATARWDIREFDLRLAGRYQDTAANASTE